MQQRLLRIILIQLRIAGILLALALMAALLLSFVGARYYGSIWQQLGISREKGAANIRTSFLNGYFCYYGAEKAVQLAEGDRTALAQDLMAFVREEVGSEAFRQRYEQERQAARPEAPQLKVRSKEAIRKEKIAETEESIRKTEQTLREVKPEVARALRPMLEVLQNNLKEYRSPDSRMIDLFHTGEQYAAENEKRNYEDRLKQWEVDYPANYKVMIRRRLEHFLSVARTVDFSAALKTVGNRRKFVNPAYEGKSSEWKMIYRAGASVIRPAMSFAEKWMAELEGEATALSR
jgi:hypothetical protein